MCSYFCPMAGMSINVTTGVLADPELLLMLLSRQHSS